MMSINSFPKIVKDILNSLPKNDYPVLNTRLYVECWLAYALDNSLTSMRDLFKRLNNTGIAVRISTFSKANTHRSQKIFQNIYHQLNQLFQKKAFRKLHNKYAICPIDSTIIMLTSKLLWVLGHHQVKLFSSLSMHLKLDKLITKNVNGIGIQIYASLIAYLILQLVSVPKQWGEKILDKFRYLQACMCQQISYVHWMEDIMKC